MAPPACQNMWKTVGRMLKCIGKELLDRKDENSLEYQF